MSKIYGLIGYPLTHSFSPEYFRQKFINLCIYDAEYRLFPLPDPGNFREHFTGIDLSGLNVTIPYKQSICNYLDALSPEALSIGAVNTIQIINGTWIGHNTDAFGFKTSLLRFIGDVDAINGALVLGDGGSARAVRYVLDELGISHLTVSRKKQHLPYEKLNEKHFENHQLIINTTPLGMYPNVESCPPIRYEMLNTSHFLFDLIYNPEKTLFLTNGTARNCKIKNGAEMLTLQADKAWEIWNQT
jgi:shikimate dehydrogenase